MSKNLESGPSLREGHDIQDMKIHEQALLSGLEFRYNKDKSEEPIWRASTLPPWRGWSRIHHASVVVHHPASKHDEKVVVISGGTVTEICLPTESVILLYDDRNKWQQGPPMQEKRSGHASVVCNGAVYAIGGRSEYYFYSTNNGGPSGLDSIERIHVRDLFPHSLSSRSRSTNGWTMLNCRLSTKRHGCAAAVVHDRFIVVAGGLNGLNYLLSVDILDTACGNSCIVTSGPSLETRRSFFGMAVIRQRIYAVGGSNRWDALSSVEYLEFDDLLDNTAKSTESVFPFSKSWTMHKELSLKSPRNQHGVVQVGSCLVVAGGYTSGVGVGSHYVVEVLDAAKDMCWELPNLKESRTGCSMVSLSNCIAVIGGLHAEEPCETIALVDKNSRLFARLVEMGKSPMYSLRNAHVERYRN